MTDKLITIARFTYGPDPVADAELAKLKLAAEGIDSFIAGKNFAGMYWLYSIACGGARIEVRQSDAERAVEILKDNKPADFEEVEESSTTEPLDDQCPNCHSGNVEYERFSKKLFYLSLLFLKFPLPFSKKSFKCNNCGHSWQDM